MTDHAKRIEDAAIWYRRATHRDEDEAFEHLQAVIRAAMRAGGDPVGWKHDCAALLTNDVELWIDACPHCGKPRHTHPQPAAQDAERYRLLNLGVDVIQADDEFLSDDTTTWGTDPNGVFVGMPYQGYALLPARRKLVAAIAAQQGDKT